MPTDNVIIDNGPLGQFEVSADDATDGSGLMQRVKLATSGDGESTHIPADVANGLDVDVTRIAPGTGSTQLGKAEDAPHASGDVGVMALGVRKDTGGTLESSDGDYAPLQVDASGNLRVVVTGGSAAVTEWARDAPAGATDHGTMPLSVRKDAAGSLVSADGDYAPLQTDATGKLRVTGDGPLYGPSEYTTDDALPTNSTGPHVHTRKITTPVATAPVDGDAQGLRSSGFGALWTAPDLVNHQYGSLTVKRAKIDLGAAATDTAIVAAVATKKIRVLAARISADATASTLTLGTKPAGASTAISPTLKYAANGGEVLPFNQAGWFETNAGEGLSGTTPAGGGTLAILVVYVEV